MAEIKNNESQILDRGYNAVRQMAKEMVAGGADISDILFHANHLWHEFKVAALLAGCREVQPTGMYMDRYNAEQTNQLIRKSPRYKDGIDEKRVKELAKMADAGQTLDVPIIIPLNSAAKAGK